MPRVQLHELYASRIGVIDEARVSFGPGFNVITGETGAGKTLLIGALELSLGAETVSGRYALQSESKSVAVFEVDGTERVLSRDTSAAGRLRSTLDGTPTSAESLREVAAELVTIQGQHDYLTLRNKSSVVRLLDDAGTIDTNPLLALRHQLREALALRDRLGGDDGSRQREIEYLDHVANEIESAAIVSPTELDDTLADLLRLEGLIDSLGTVTAVLEGLDGEGDEALVTRTASLLSELPGGEPFGEIRVELFGHVAAFRESLARLRDLVNPELVDFELRSLLATRVSTLRQLVRKYGSTLSDVLNVGRESAERASMMRSESERFLSLEGEIVQLEQAEREEARRVRKEREYAAVTLTNAVRQQLPRVALPQASLRFEVDGIDGSDAQILFAPNPGMPEGPLQSLASGGELSRVLLAIALETNQQGLVSVFDEIDAGIGGEVAQQIGGCLEQLGRAQQVIAVTHLGSVAAQATHHFVISKSNDSGRTVTTVNVVTGEDRVREIARMLAGDAGSDEALELARRLLNNR